MLSIAPWLKFGLEHRGVSWQYHGEVVNACNGEHVLYSEKLNPAGGGRIVEWFKPALMAIVFSAADISEL